MAGVDLLTVRHGLISEVHLFSEDGANEDTFWGHPGEPPRAALREYEKGRRHSCCVRHCSKGSRQFLTVKVT